MTNILLSTSRSHNTVMFNSITTAFNSEKGKNTGFEKLFHIIIFRENDDS
jgi:hypothetical protein